jgi:tripartite-type tricarboxylate transporter receptor subunit TctC
MKIFTSALCALGIYLICTLSQAQDYPTRVGKIIAPYAPGGTVDALAREIAMAFTSSLGKSFIVENKPGAGGNVGLATLSKAPKDGYTLGIGAANMLITNRFVYPTLAFDTLKDFAPIAFIGRVPFILVVNKNVKADTIRELIALVKAKQELFNFGSSGVGNTGHLYGELLKIKTGIEMQHIPFKSSGEATQEVVTGRIQIQFGTPIELMPHITKGSIKAIAVAGSQRLALLPTTPTLSESGISGFESPTWFGLIAPSGTPKEIVSLLNSETQKALKSNSVKIRLEQSGLETQYMTPEQFSSFLNDEITKWEQIVKSSELKIN